MVKRRLNFAQRLRIQDENRHFRQLGQHNMLVFWKTKLVMLAVPKTGTSSYESVLSPHADVVISDPPELKHATVYRYNRFLRPMFEKVGAEHMDLLAVIRDPVTWLESWYKYRRRPFLDGRPTSTKDISFDQFVQAYCQDKRPPFANVGSQAKFVEARPNAAQVNLLFAYENQPALQNYLEDRLNLSLNIPRINVSPEADLSLSRDSRHLLETTCPADFSIWEQARTQNGAAS